MTDSRLTQTAVEQWAAPLPSGQVTQVAVEQWASVSSGTVQALATQIAVEQWAPVAVASSGQSVRAMVLG